MFELALHIQRESLEAAQPGQVSEDYELNTAEAQLMAACELLADAAVADFRLICCGELAWPVDVRTDLSVFLSQSVGVLQALDAGAPCFRLEMYEQGIETALIFRRVGGRLHVHCEPILASGDSRLCTRDEELDMTSLVLAVADVITGFTTCCTRLCPQLLVLPEMTHWRKTVEQLVEGLRGTE
ncbi:MAG TPA: hypothetical protein VK539_21640 [Myxococcaceae bacterium]|nr:hypothetical protein [Myxococcaceae bacterium]